MERDHRRVGPLKERQGADPDPDAEGRKVPVDEIIWELHWTGGPPVRVTMGIADVMAFLRADRRLGPDQELPRAEAIDLMSRALMHQRTLQGDMTVEDNEGTTWSIPRSSLTAVSVRDTTRKAPAGFRLTDPGR
jgi:hypothetical protein